MAFRSTFLLRPVRPIVRILLLSVAGGGLVTAQPRSVAWTQTFDAATIWDDNVSNSDRANEEVDAFSLRGTVGVDGRRALPDSRAISFIAALASEYATDYTALNVTDARLGGAFQQKFGLGPSAPTLSAAGHLLFRTAAQREREGIGGELRVTARQRLAERWSIEGEAQVERFDAHHRVFSHGRAALSVRVRLDFAEGWALFTGLTWRDGDVVSYAIPPRPDIRAAAEALREHDTTFGQPRTVYRLDGSAWQATAALVFAVNDRSAISGLYEYRTVDVPTADYEGHRVSLSWTSRF